jgi:DNA-binding transcriptional ArsR family regulator
MRDGGDGIGGHLTSNRFVHRSILRRKVSGIMVGLFESPRFDYHRNMLDTPNIAAVGALIGDPTRGRMLAALMDGRALTATELAIEGGVTSSTASSHLARMSAAGLVSLVVQGRHRYYRLSAPEVATAIESLMSIAPRNDQPTIRTSPRDEALRHARVCYDHLAGEAAVQMLRQLQEKNILAGTNEKLSLTDKGQSWCASVGIDVDALREKRRPFCRACLDWTERRTHLAGALGAAILDRLLALRYARREMVSRAVILSPRGEMFVKYLELRR